MKSKLLILSSVLVFGALAANAGTTVLTFEGLKDNEQVLNYYNGGFGGNGSGPGPNDGITFGPDSMALISNTAGGSGNFDGNPSGATVLYFLTGPGDVMNVAAGFKTGFSFYYSSPFFTGAIQVFSGQDGTGTLLANLILPETPAGEGTGSCNNTDAYCPWEPIGVAFAGTAKSVIFSGTANFIAFDNVTLGASSPTPEPASLLLMGLGVSGLGLVGWRRRARA